ncbi:S-methyl-5-thioribose-1-phosphate isomerase [bacterium]|nr:S-methyl-5-thioribose-1-phosphate isomerase [bacterium]
MVNTVRWDGKILWILDQRRLPVEVVYEKCETVKDVARCIRNMFVRGAPAIGVTAAFGMVIAAKEGLKKENMEIWLKDQSDILEGTRPTAVNLAWATRKMLAASVGFSGEQLVCHLETLAQTIYKEDIDSCRNIGLYSAPYVPEKATILTHCNAGALATAGYGTALGVIRRAVEEGKEICVFADETRPFLQGARLTAWELMEDGIDVTLITDNMAAYFMGKGEIDLVVVGADRIAANGDTANKIGTYSVALAARAHEIPFIVAAPMNTVDFSLNDGSLIPIEERNTREVTHWAGIQMAPDGVKVRNPAFDITPHELITAIITDLGAVSGDYKKGLNALNG